MNKLKIKIYPKNIVKVNRENRKINISVSDPRHFIVYVN
jgi:hypothetical protein